MKLNKSKIKFIRLIIFCVVILVMPILAINVDFIKNIAFALFKNKANAYQYLQFSGIFFGIMATVMGAFITIEYKIDKEKNHRIEIQNCRKK